jgi:hypothetical protein
MLITIIRHWSYRRVYLVIDCAHFLRYDPIRLMKWMLKE